MSEVVRGGTGSPRPAFTGEHVSDHQAPEVVGQAAFQTTHRLVVRLAGDDFRVVVGATGNATPADLGARGTLLQE